MVLGATDQFGPVGIVSFAGVHKHVIRNGISYTAITPDLRSKYKLTAGQQGVVVTAVTVGGDAANQSIDAGMVIEKVRDTPVSAAEDVLKSVETDRQQRRPFVPFVPMLISSAGGRRWVAFPLQ